MEKDISTEIQLLIQGHDTSSEVFKIQLLYLSTCSVVNLRFHLTLLNIFDLN